MILAPMTNTNQIHKREHSSSAVRSVSRKDVTELNTVIPLSNSDVKLPPLSAINENKLPGEQTEKTSTTPRHPETNSIRLPRLSLSTKPQSLSQSQPISESDTAATTKTLPLTARFEKVQQQSNVGPSPPHKSLQRTATVSYPSSPKWKDLNNENIGPSYSSNPPANPPPAPPGPPSLTDSKEVKEAKEVKELKELKDVMLTPKGSKMSLNEVLQKLNDLEMRVIVKEKFAETEQTDLKKQMEDMKSSLDNLVSVINQISVKFVVT